MRNRYLWMMTFWIVLLRIVGSILALTSALFMVHANPIGLVGNVWTTLTYLMPFFYPLGISLACLGIASGLASLQRMERRIAKRSAAQQQAAAQTLPIP